jgi:hypothetical protein
MNQLTWKQAEELATAAAEHALGFGPRSGKVTLDASEVARVARDAAYVALQRAGCLVRHQQHQDQNDARLANEATRKHQEWCAATGNRY